MTAQLACLPNGLAQGRMARVLHAVLVVATAICSGLLPHSAAAQPAPLAGLDAYLRAAMADWQVPGLAIAIVKDDAVVFMGTYSWNAQRVPRAIEAVFLDAHSSVDRAPAVDVRRTDGQLVQTIATTDFDSQLRDLKWRPPEEFVVKAADGITALYGVMYKPYDFDPARRYPVIQTFAMATSFSQNGGYEVPAMAHLGYIVVGLRGRGSLAEGRGKVFENADRGHIGQREIADHVAGLRQLAATRPFMDLTRVGIVDGWYTGFMATRAI